MINNDVGRLYDMLLIQVEKQKIPILPKTPHNFEMGTRELVNMAGLSHDKGDEIISFLLDDKNIKIDGGKIICLDLFELEKTVNFHKKQAALERKREENRSKTY
jgi:hypothetical protein